MEISKPILEEWIKNYKSPKSTIDKAINTSQEIIKRVPDLPNFIDKANYALQLIAEGKLNLVNQDHNSIEMEKLKIKSFRNNVTITFLSVVILGLIVF